MAKTVRDHGFGDVAAHTQSLQTHLLRQESTARAASARILHLVWRSADHDLVPRSNCKRHIEFRRVTHRIERQVKSANEHHDSIVRRENWPRGERDLIVCNAQGILGIRRTGDAAHSIGEQQAGELQGDKRIAAGGARSLLPAHGQFFERRISVEGVVDQLSHLQGRMALPRPGQDGGAPASGRISVKRVVDPAHRLLNDFRLANPSGIHGKLHQGLIPFKRVVA